MILGYICDGLAPLSTVQNESFKKLVLNGFPHCRVPCRDTITSLLMKETDGMKNKLRADFEHVTHVCITADGWSAHHR